jgi:hypothetical protein
MVTARKRREAKALRMARKKSPTGGPGTVVRIESDLVAKGRYLAICKGMELSAYLSELLRPIIEREFKKAGRELREEEEKT